MKIEIYFLNEIYQSLNPQEMRSTNGNRDLFSVRYLSKHLRILPVNWKENFIFWVLSIKKTFEQLEPGDLVFCEGEYHTGRHLQQKYNMVHVEIYLGSEFGTGPESTLGSRNRFGCVEVHDSFRYESKYYYIHGRSLNISKDYLKDMVKVR